MADLQKDRDTREREVTGLNYLATGMPMPQSRLGNTNDAALNDYHKHLVTLLNKNVPIDVPPGAISQGGLVAYAAEAATGQMGTKEFLHILLDRQIGNEPVDVHQVSAIKAAMSAAGFPADLREYTFSEQEQASLPRFKNNLGGGLSLNEIANSNFISNTENANRADSKMISERKAAAEQQVTPAQGKDLQEKVAAMLVYGGRLKPEEIFGKSDEEKKMAIARSMHKFIGAKSPHQDHFNEEQKVFANTDTWELRPYSLQYLKRELAGITPQNTNRDGDLLIKHLESGDPDLIGIAQDYLVTTGHTGVSINGTLDGPTTEAALAEMRAPLTVPDNLIGENGKVRYDNLVQAAVDGNLFLPVSSLSEEKQKIAMSFPLAQDREWPQTMTREKYVALELIGKDTNPPAMYQAILDAENVRRADATFKGMELPVVAIPPTATIDQEQKIAQNPVGIKEYEGDAPKVTAAAPIAAAIKEYGVGETDRLGYVVFDDQKISIQAVADALRLRQEEIGGPINMHVAFGVVQETMTGRADMPISAMEDVQPIAEQLGYTAGGALDVANDPAAMTAALKSITMYADLVAARKQGDFSFIPDAEAIPADVTDAIKKTVSGASPQESPKAEAAPLAYEFHSPKLREIFRPNAAALEPQAPRPAVEAEKELATAQPARTFVLG